MSVVACKPQIKIINFAKIQKKVRKKKNMYFQQFPLTVIMVYSRAVAKCLKHRIVYAEVLGSSPNQSMEELSRSSFNHCLTPPRCNRYTVTGTWH